MVFSNNQSELNFDNIAFLLFLFSGSVLAGLILIGFLMKDVWERTRQNNKYKGLQNVSLFSIKIENMRRMSKKRNLIWDNKYKFAGLLLCLFVVIICLSHQEFGEQLTGFDPYEILGVSFDASQSQIKKAYRKLALSHHPDRSNYHSSNNFIKISKAYQCLTQLSGFCLNSEGDGQLKKIGIGLPPYVLKEPYNLYFALPLFVLFLVVIPVILLRWIDSKQKNQNFQLNQQSMRRFIGLKHLDTIKLCGVFGTMKETCDLFPKENFTKDREKQIREFLENSCGVDGEKLKRISSKELYIGYETYRYLKKQINSVQICEKFMQVNQQMITFCVVNGKKRKGNKGFQKQGNFMGMKPLLRCVQFSRQMFNRLEVPMGKNSFGFLVDLNEEQIERISVYENINLQSIICCQQETQKYFSLLDGQKSQELKKYLKYLPHLQLQTSITVAQRKRNKIRRDDVVYGRVVVSKINEGPGFVVCPNFPMIAEESFLLIVSDGGRLVTSLLFTFSQRMQISHIFKIKKIPKKELRLKIRVLSLNYYNLDLSETIRVKVQKTKRRIRKVCIHEEDQKLEKVPKNFFESLVNFEKQDAQDVELSDGESSEQEKLQQKKQRKGNRFVNKRMSSSFMEESEQNRKQEQSQ